MSNERLLDRLRSRIAQRRKATRLEREEENALAQAIDQVLKASAPMVCSLRDCRRDLRSPVQNALDYLRQAIAAIPGPVPLAPELWGQDPLLHALFVDAEEMKAVLAADRRLRTFFSRHRQPQAFALLTATKQERTIFVTALEGGIVRRDVPQTAVEFHDHRFVDPSSGPADTRCALKNRALNGLVTQVLERLLNIRALKDKLKEQQHILSIQFKIQQTRMQGLEALKADETSAESMPSAEPQVLADIGRQLQDLGLESDSPEEYLRQLAAVLNAPQQVFTVTPITLRLNWMGVKQGGASTTDEGGVRLAEVEFQDRLKRVAVLVAIARQDCVKT
jgi:hypothetical protein